LRELAGGKGRAGSTSTCAGAAANEPACCAPALCATNRDTHGADPGASYGAETTCDAPSPSCAPHSESGADPDYANPCGSSTYPANPSLGAHSPGVDPSVPAGLVCCAAVGDARAWGASRGATGQPPPRAEPLAGLLANCSEAERPHLQRALYGKGVMDQGWRGFPSEPPATLATSKALAWTRTNAIA